jgi:hypothetical protein
MTLGPRNKEEELVFAQEALRVDIQQFIYEAMKKQSITEWQLAKMLRVRSVKRIFDDDWNPRIREVVKIFDILGKEFNLTLIKDK